MMVELVGSKASVVYSRWNWRMIDRSLDLGHMRVELVGSKASVVYSRWNWRMIDRSLD